MSISHHLVYGIISVRVIQDSKEEKLSESRMEESDS